MPVKLSKTGKAAIGPTGKVEKRFASRKKARAYVQARGIAEKRRKGKR